MNKKKRIGSLFCLIILFSFLIPLIESPPLGIKDVNATPDTSTNFLFNGKTYTFNLDDFYDDTNLYKQYTGANFSTEAFNGTSLEWTGVVQNDTVSLVDNTEIQYGTPSGVYNGTYDFREYADGTSGTDIDNVQNLGGGMTATIIGELGGHKKVLKYLVTAGHRYTKSYYYLPAVQTSGTIEFWVYAGTYDYMYQFRDVNSNYIFQLRFYSGATVSLYHDGGTSYYSHDITEWTHVKIIFDCADGSSGIVSVWIDDILAFDSYDMYATQEGSLYRYNIQANSDSESIFYMDAIGFKTGDYLATESFDYTTEEDVYYGTYDFRDELGETGTDIDYVTTTSFDVTEIVSDYSGHKYVMNVSSSASGSLYHYYDETQVSGTTEFYYKSISGATYWNLRALNGEWLIQFRMYTTYVLLYYGDGVGGSLPESYTFTTDFPHYKVEFDTVTDRFTAWVEGVKVIDNLPFLADADGDTAYRERIYCSGAFELYYDAVGHSWDTTSHSGLGYEIGYNINPYDIEPLLENYLSRLTMVYDTSIRISSYVDGHSNVLNLTDDSGSDFILVESVFTQQTSGTMEFYVEISSLAINSFWIRFYTTWMDGIMIKFDNGDIEYTDGSWHTISSYSADIWYHFKIEFDTTDDWHLWIDEVSKDGGTGYDYYGSPSSLSIFRSNTIGTAFENSAYIDAFGIVGVNGYEEGDNLGGWDKDYTIGENLYPDNFIMLNGSYDYTDNMKINDASYTTFTSTHSDGYIPEMPSQWDDFTFTNGTGITIGDLENIDADWSVITSSHTYGYIHEMPSQWDDFTFTKGSGTTIGDLETIDADYSVIRDDYSVVDSDFTIIPDVDSTPLQWTSNPPGAHWSKIDEDPDANDGDTTQVWVLINNNLVDVIDYSSGDIEGASVYKIVVRYAYRGAGPAGYDAYIDINLGGWQGYKKVTRPGTPYTAQNLEWTGLSGDQTDVNGFQIRLKSYISGLNSNHFTAIWVIVYYSGGDIDLDFQVDMQITDPDFSSIEYFKYSHKTNVSATIDLDIWNWNTPGWYEIESINNFATFDDDSFTLGSSSNYVSGTNQVRIRFQLNTGSADFELQIDRFRLDYFAISAELDVQIDMQVIDPDFTVIEYFKYSHRTNVSSTIDLDIWNWGGSSWFEIESIDNFATFDDDSFTLGSASPYVNSSNGVRIRFQASIDPLNNFELQIDRFRLDYLTIPTELEMVITFPFAQYNEDLLAMNIQSWQRTNISQTINFSIWNYNTEAYIQISSSSDISFTQNEYNTTSPADFFSPAGTVKLYWNGTDDLDDFELHIDYLLIRIYYKLDLEHSKSFDTNGIYRYRWVVIGSVYYTQWVTFEVVDPDPNFHAISESDATTRWVLQGADINPLENFTDDIDPSSTWDLSGVSQRDFLAYIPELGNYLTDNNTFYGSSYISPDQWGDFSFTKGAGNTVGELETDNDADYAIIDSEFELSGESLLGTIKPADSDITTGWNGDTPHWSRLDEGVGGAPDALVISAMSGVNDKWNFDSLVIPVGRVVTKLVFYGYCDDLEPAPSATIEITTSVGASGGWIVPVDYAWVSDTASGLNFGQVELDAFWMNVYSDMGGSSLIILETVYVKVWTSLKQYSVDYTITWDVTDPISMDYFNYDYRTTFAIDCDLDIYNWDTTDWNTELESNTGTSWITGSYNLTDPYISVSDQIKVRFQSALTTTDFDMELDQIVIKYNSLYTISKKHNNTISGYAYMQTNITELVTLGSTVYGTNYTLNSADYFEVDFQTSSDSQINLILLEDSVINKTLVLSPSGNPNFNRHTVQISVDEFVEFDQLKISSTFEDTDYIKVYDIKTFKYTLTGDYADFYVGSKRTEDIYLTPDIYNLRIFEESTKKVDTNVTIDSTDYYYVYTPTQTQYCRLALFNTEGTSLIFTDYHIKVNRSLNGEYNQLWLLDNIFSADEETYVYIDVYDRFDALINSFERMASDYIDLELEVYSLQIKNLQTQKTTVDINTTHIYPLLSEESLYFMLAKDYYQIGYYDTNDVYKQFLIYLNSNQAYELNRSKIVFLAFINQRGEHLFFDNYKTYVNGTLLYENIFYKEIGDDIGIEIQDLYDISIKNQTYTVVSGDNYIPVVLTMYSLKVINQQEIFNHINITRDPNYYESPYYWSEWVAPNEIIELNLFAGYYKINLTDNEGGSYSFYEYTLSGDDILLISSDNIISQVIYNIANVNTTIGNQITNVEINITNQNSEINNTIVNIEINLSNVNSTLGNLLVSQGIQITNIENNITSLYTFTNNSFINLNNVMNTSFIYMENNIIAINQTISTLVIGVDGKITIVGATINTMFTEMSNQFIVTQSTINYSFAFLNQTIIQIGNNITSNQIALQNLIIQRANDIDSSLINIQNLINLVNNTVANESLVVQTLINLIGANITSNHIIINSLLNLIDNNITNNNIQLVSILDVIGNNITTNHFVIQTLIDLVGNNITDNHLELVTTLNLINNTMDQNQIELINRLLFINNSINEIALDLTNQLIFLNNTIYSAILDVSVSIDFATDNILGNISITYQQNDFLTELYKRTMFSQLLNWSDVAYNYTLMEDRIDVWEFINNYKNESGLVLLRYNNLIHNLTVSAQNTIEQYLPSEGVEYRIKSVATGEYLDDWEPLPENRSVNFGFYEEEVPIDQNPFFLDFVNLSIFLMVMAAIGMLGMFFYFRIKYQQKKLNPRIKKKGRRRVGEGTYNDGVVL